MVGGEFIGELLVLELGPVELVGAAPLGAALAEDAKANLETVSPAERGSPVNVSVLAGLPPRVPPDFINSSIGTAGSVV